LAAAGFLMRSTMIVFEPVAMRSKRPKAGRNDSSPARTAAGEAPSASASDEAAVALYTL
jgi:hypothetical protein